MGWWTLEAWKENTNGDKAELNMDDLGHIAEAIEQGYTSGEVYDEDDDEQIPESICDNGSIVVS